MPLPPTACPDLEDWCGYVDGSLPVADASRLTSHVEQCDRCFATLTQLRRDLVELPDPHIKPVARGTSTAQALVYAAAAVLCLMWVGGQQWMPGAEVVGTEMAEAEVFGFAADRAQTLRPLQRQDRVLVVFTQFGGGRLLPVPSWASTLLAHPGAGCGVSDGVDLPQGTVLPHRLQARWPEAAYNDVPSNNRRRFVQQIATQLQTLDLSTQDGDGDGVADFVVVVVGGVSAAQLPEGMQASAGLGADFDAGSVRISGHPRRGALVVERGPQTPADICRQLERAMTP